MDRNEKQVILETNSSRVSIGLHRRVPETCSCSPILKANRSVSVTLNKQKLSRNIYNPKEAQVTKCKSKKPIKDSQNSTAYCANLQQSTALFQ